MVDRVRGPVLFCYQSGLLHNLHGHYLYLWDHDNVHLPVKIRTIILQTTNMKMTTVRSTVTVTANAVASMEPEPEVALP